MALTQIYTAVAGDTITALRWNNEYGNIYNNGTDVAFPLTKAVSFAGYTVTLDAAGNSTISSPTTTGILITPGSKSGTPSASGSMGSVASHTFTDSATAASGTAALYTGFSFRTPTLAASNTNVVTTRAATVYIEAAPIQGTNETLTTSYALLVEDGTARFEGNADFVSTVYMTGPLAVNLPVNSFSANYDVLLSDQGRQLQHAVTDNNARTVTIPANVSIAFPVGAMLTFVNFINVLSIAITSDTMYLAGTSSSGTRTLAANGVATALKVTANIWIISGTGLA